MMTMVWAAAGRLAQRGTVGYQIDPLEMPDAEATHFWSLENSHPEA